MTVRLSKGQSISLAKPNGTRLTMVRMGLGWDPITTRGFLGRPKVKPVDLDASCLVFNARGQLIDQVWFQQLTSRCHSIRHTGDNRTGAGAGDDESIIVDLSMLPREAATLIFTVNSFLGQTFNDVTNATCRLVDEASGAELARYDLSAQGPHTAQVMAKLSRMTGEWSMTAIGRPASGRTFGDLMPAISPYVP